MRNTATTADSYIHRWPLCDLTCRCRRVPFAVDSSEFEQWFRNVQRDAEEEIDAKAQAAEPGFKAKLKT